MTPNSPTAIGPMLRVRVYVSETDTIGRTPASQAVVTFLRTHNAAGVTVLRALEGFGASGRLHASRIGEDDGDLPLVIEWIDSRQRVDALLPELCPMVPAGMVTVLSCQRAPSWSPGQFSGDRISAANLAASSRTASTSSGDASS